MKFLVAVVALAATVTTAPAFAQNVTRHSEIYEQTAPDGTTYRVTVTDETTVPTLSMAPSDSYSDSFSSCDTPQQSGTTGLENPLPFTGDTGYTPLATVTILRGK